MHADFDVVPKGNNKVLLSFFNYVDHDNTMTRLLETAFKMRCGRLATPGHMLLLNPSPTDIMKLQLVYEIRATAAEDAGSCPRAASARGF